MIVYLTAPYRIRMHARIKTPQTGGLRREKAECGLKVAARRGAIVRHVEDSKKLSCMKLPNTCVYKSTLHTSSHPLRRRPHLQTCLPGPVSRTKRPTPGTTSLYIPEA
jgi:hypothetical protein